MGRGEVLENTGVARVSKPRMRKVLIMPDYGISTWESKELPLRFVREGRTWRFGYPVVGAGIAWDWLMAHGLLEPRGMALQSIQTRSRRELLQLMDAAQALYPIPETKRDLVGWYASIPRSSWVGKGTARDVCTLRLGYVAGETDLMGFVRDFPALRPHETGHTDHYESR
jgi:hypothetical protein